MISNIKKFSHFYELIIFLFYFILIFPLSSFSEDGLAKWTAVQNETKEYVQKLMDEKVKPRYEAEDNHAMRQFKNHYSLKTGDKWNKEGEYYEKHEWFDGNPDWMDTWVNSETDVIMSDLMDCLNVEIEVVAVVYVYYDTLIFISIQYWWPEVTGEAGNYCIGSFLTGQFRDIFIEIKEMLIPMFLGKLKSDDEHGKAFKELRDGKVGETPNKGQTHNDRTGVRGEEARHYEAHLHRTFFDTLISLIAARSSNWGTFDCLRQCLKYNPPDKWFPIMWSEALLAPAWRFPELSLLRLTDRKWGAKKYSEYYKMPAIYSLLPGYLEHGTSMSPFMSADFKIGEMDLSGYDISSQMKELNQAIKNMQGIATIMGFLNTITSGGFGLMDIIGLGSSIKSIFTNGSFNDVFNTELYADSSILQLILETLETMKGAGWTGVAGLNNLICAAYRASNQYDPRFAANPHDKNPIWVAFMNADGDSPLRHRRYDEIDKELSKMCYHQSLDQLYPLMGSVWGNAERVAPITAIRRLWEWQSMNMWGKFLRQNFYNDFGTRRRSDEVTNFYRLPRLHYVMKGKRKSDKIQRLYPSPTECFSMNQIDERNLELFPHEMFEEDNYNGTYKIVQWNRRVCLVVISVMSRRCFYGLPLEE